MSGDSLTQAKRDAAIAEAKAAGIIVVESDPRHLLLDLDTPFAVAQFERVVAVLRQFHEAVEEARWFSKSGNLHVVLRLGEDMRVLERLVWQAALGSDGVREGLALQRLKNGIAEPSLLFRPSK